MYLTQAMQDFILHWGDMGAKWGTNRSVAQIHALLHIAPEPMTADEICSTLNLARSNVSTGLKELQAMGIVQASRKLGERKDRFHSIRDVFDLVRIVVSSRREREYEPTLAALKNVQDNAKSDGTPDDIRKWFADTLQTMEMFDSWYAEVARLPRPVQLAVVKLGAGIARFIPNSK